MNPVDPNNPVVTPVDPMATTQAPVVDPTMAAPVTEPVSTIPTVDPTMVTPIVPSVDPMAQSVPMAPAETPVVSNDQNNAGGMPPVTQ